MEAHPSPDVPGEISGRRASVTAVVGVLGAVALMLLLVTWSATIGPEKVIRGSGNPPSYATATTFPNPSPAAQPSSHRDGDGEKDVLFTVVMIVAALLASIVTLALVLSAVPWLLTRDWRFRRREPEPDEVAFDPLDAPALVAEALVAGAREQRDLLAGGSARNAIVACWHRFEELADAAGVRRHAWETSSEFTLRFLDRLAADSTAVTSLAELYRAARHSDHQITEDDRTAAQVALDVVHRSLGVTAGSGTRGHP